MTRINGYWTGFVRPSVGLSHMNYVEDLLNLTTQLDNSSLAQAMLHVVQCVCKKSISTYRKHTSSAQSGGITFHW